LNWLVYPKYILDPTEGIHFGKVRGPFVSASADGLAMAMGLPIFIWLLFNRRDTSRWLWIFGLVSVGISTPYVYQRSAWLGVALALGVTALTWPKHRGILIASIALVLPCAAMFVLTSNRLEQEVQTKLNTSNTIDFRLNMIDLSLAQIREHPVTGVGFNRFVEQLAEDENYYSAASHNTPLTLFVELGLLGFVPYLMIYGALLFESLKSYMQHTWSRSMIALLWSVTAPFFATTNLTDTRILMYQNILLFGLWGIVLGIVRRKAGSVEVAEVARRRATRAMALSSQPGGAGIPGAWERFK